LDPIIDSAGFSAFFSEYRMRFIRFASGYLRDDHLAEDFVVDSMMTFWLRRAELPADTNPPAYVLTVLKNKCIDYLRRLRRDQAFVEHQTKEQVWDLNTRIASLEDFIPDEVFTQEIQEIVTKAVAELSEETRQVFLLSRRQGLSHREIAARMGITEKGVEYHITKVNRLLRSALKDYLSVAVLLFYLS
jgi:RNA polymerase sigma-70 factor (ECF subfamily)